MQKINVLYGAVKSVDKYFNYLLKSKPFVSIIDSIVGTNMLSEIPAYK